MINLLWVTQLIGEEARFEPCNPAPDSSLHFLRFGNVAELPLPFTLLSLVPSTHLALGNHLLNIQLDEMNEHVEEQLRQNSSGHGKGELIYGRKLDRNPQTESASVKVMPEARRRLEERKHFRGSNREEAWVVEHRDEAGIRLREHRAYLAACGHVRKVWQCHQVSIRPGSAGPRHLKGCLCSAGCRAGQRGLT